MLFLSLSQLCQSTIRAETLVCVAVIRKDSEKLSNNFDFRGQRIKKKLRLYFGSIGAVAATVRAYK